MSSIAKSVTTPLLPCGCPRASHGDRSVGPFGLRYRHYLPGCAAGRHAHAESRIILPLYGSFDTQHGRHAIPVPVGMALYRPVDDEHSDHYTMPIDCLALTLPAADELPATRLPFAMHDAALPDAARVLRVEMLARDSASNLVIEGLAQLVLSVVFHQRRAETGVPRWIHTVREQLAAHTLNPPTLAELGREVQRDPAYVSATFQRVFGHSPGTYLRHLRLWQARAAIDATPTTPLADIAHTCGFADQSHFTRHFRRLFHLTPAQYRRRHGVADDASA